MGDLITRRVVRNILVETIRQTREELASASRKLVELELMVEDMNVRWSREILPTWTRPLNNATSHLAAVTGGLFMLAGVDEGETIRRISKR